MSESSPLLSLPTELLLALVDAIHDPESERNFAITCKLARLLTEPILYRTLLVTNGDQAERLAHALQQGNGRRADFVQSLDLRPQYDADEGIEELIPTLAKMTHLRSLSMESPFANEHRWNRSGSRWEVITSGFRTLFQRAHSGVGLQDLESLTIHWSGEDSEFWMLEEFRAVLALPALRSLTVSGAAIVADDWGVEAGTTALTHLELIECFATQQGLSSILSLPRALRSCHLGQLRHTHLDVENAHEHEEASPTEQLEALRSQQHALQSLVWQDAAFAYDLHIACVPTPPSGPGLSDFTELGTLTLDGPCAFLLSLLLSPRAPPNLQRLRLVRHDTAVLFDLLPTHNDVSATRIPSIPHPSALLQHLPTLRHLDVVLSPVGSNSVLALWDNPARRDRVRRLSGDLRARGVEFRVFTAWREPGLIPPYLFGEYVPVERVVYA